ncbi:hypothetical protein BN11_4980009 [Nostocoides australiense Ben110]|uniref:Uncharacterized protein n=1 Tax=Nostocoides australiense Ben110 TaxID=1193182 RepID=W6K1Q7_9MICO|nr:hypothetical protein BN11_4980009 [Tetrasphaera australiensis Ben110]
MEHRAYPTSSALMARLLEWARPAAAAIGSGIERQPDLTSQRIPTLVSPAGRATSLIGLLRRFTEWSIRKEA